MSYTHLNTFERGQIEAFCAMDWSIRHIAKALGRSPSTICRELRRNAVDTCYQAETAQKAYEKRRKKSRPAGKWNFELAALITEKMGLTWSPEQITGRLFSGKLCFKTIYRWIHQGQLPSFCIQYLRRKGKSPRTKETRGKIPIGLSIHQRPADVKTRSTFGHWELDTVVSSRGQSKGCLATFVERKTRFYVALPMKDRTAASMEKALQTLYGSYPTKAFITATADRGKEFACHAAVKENLHWPIYFADPYSSWQRGSNENSNGLLREFFPKVSDLAKVTLHQVSTAVALMNHRPRKCLHWRSPHEAFMEEVFRLA